MMIVAKFALSIREPEIIMNKDYLSNLDIALKEYQMKYLTLMLALLVVVMTPSIAQAPEKPDSTAAAPVAVALPIKLAPYSFAMKISTNKQLTGYYSEKLSADGDNWFLMTQETTLETNGYYKKFEQWEISFDRTLRLLSFCRVIQYPQQEEYLCKGMVKNEKILVADSKKKSQSFDFPVTSIPLPLAMLHFLTQKEKQLACQTVSLISGKFSQWLIKLNEYKQIKNRFRKTVAESDEEKITEETPDMVTVGVVEMQKTELPPEGGEPRPVPNSAPTIYHIIMAGEQVIPGIWTSQVKGDTRYSWIRRKDYNIGVHMSKQPPKREFSLRQQLDILKDMSEKLKDENIEVRRVALHQIVSMKLMCTIPALIVASQDKDPALRKQANQALSRLTGKSYVNYRQWQMWWQSNEAKIMKQVEEALQKEAGAKK